MAGSGGEEAVVSAHDWVRGITFSILASMIGGASKLSIRKSCEFVHIMLSSNERIHICVFACVDCIIEHSSPLVVSLYVYNIITTHMNNMYKLQSMLIYRAHSSCQEKTTAAYTESKSSGQNKGYVISWSQVRAANQSPHSLVFFCMCGYDMCF